MRQLMITVTLVLAAAVLGFEMNPTLSGMGDTTFMEIQNCTVFQKTLVANNIMDFSGMVYNFHQHKILAFGGGHATALFPSNVAEFDFASLKWSFLVNIDSVASCTQLYTAANALFSTDSQKLGGFRYGGRVYAGSRHTYDGLEMAADTNLMLLTQAQEFRGCNIADYDTYFGGGNGLFILDPGRKEWSVSSKAGLATSYCYSAVNPDEPDWVYLGSAGMGGFNAVNWRTGEKVAKRSVGFSAGSDMSMTYDPERKSFFAFPYSAVYEYSISANTWTKLAPAGTAPSGYSLNVVYDTLNKVFCTFYDSSFYYYSSAQNTWFHQTTKYKMSRLFHHHVYDPVNNVHLMAGYPWLTYAYKFSDKAGQFFGTGGVARTDRGFNARNRILFSANPNPCNRSTSIRYGGFSNPGSLEIISITGAVVREFLLSSSGAGAVKWDGRDRQGRLAAAGVYIARISNGKTARQIRLILAQ